MSIDANEFARRHGPDALRREIDGASVHAFDLPPQEQADAIAFDPPPYAFPDPATIPPRAWLYGRHYIRGAVGATIGAPGRLKSTLVLTEFIGMSVGRDLMTGEPLVAGPLRAAYLNGEENQEELDRRVAAICKHYNVTKADCGGRLWVLSTRDNPIRLAVLDSHGAKLDQQAVEKLKAWCDRDKIDVLGIDPLISFHRVRESDNGDMDLVCKEGFGAIAGKERSVEIVHHPRKPAPGEVNTTVDDARGASAVLGAVRVARTLNFMTGSEAVQLGIADDERRLHVRIENGKNNPGPIGKAHWARIEVENLPNGDEVACASPWKPENPFQNVTTRDMELAQRLAQTGAYRADPRSPEWFGWPLAQQLGMTNVRFETANPKDLAKLKHIIKTWITTGVLTVHSRLDKDRKKRNFIAAGTFAPPASILLPEEDNPVLQ